MTGDGHKCSIYMYNKEKRYYKHVASSIKEFIPYILELIHVEQISRIYRSTSFKNKFLDNIQSIWTSEPIKRGYYGYINGIYDFREGIFHAYKDHYLPHNDEEEDDDEDVEADEDGEEEQEKEKKHGAEVKKHR